MNGKALATQAGAFLGAAGLVVGVHVAASNVAALRHDRDTYRAEAARPRPTTTRVVTEPPAAAPHTPGRPAGGPSGSAPGAGGAPQQGGGVAAVSARRPAPSTPRPGPGTPSGPRPSPPAATPARRCDVAAVVAVVDACVRLGR